LQYVLKYYPFNFYTFVILIINLKITLMAEISIYGEIVPFKWFDSGFEYDLSDLNRSLEALKDITEGEELIINIHCPGGCTVTGFAIFNKLRRFKEEKKITITTRVDGYCASMGVAILLAGDKRIGNAFAEPFVHNAWSWVWDGVDKKSALKIAEDLTRTDNLIATLYEQRTNISQADALLLMDAETWLTPEQCMEKGFYTELEDALVPVDKEVFNTYRAQRPTKQNNSNNNNNAMSNKKKESILNRINKLFAKNLIVFTAEQKELDFYDLVEGETPGIGDKATFDGKPAGDSNDGTYVMSSGETYVFTGEELTTITPADENTEDATDLAAENAALKEKIANLEASEVSNKLEISNLKKDLKSRNSLLKELAAVEADDGEDDTPKPEAGRQNNAGKKDEVLTRNLWAGIK
jgi:ATP-dependent protease ClpP protease subunit